MLVFILPQGRSEADARRLANAVVSSRSARGVVTRTQLGTHHGRHFSVAYVYPAEYGDGMGPRTHYLRTQWVWLNDGKSLESTLQPRSE